jgi:hypothetical protein
MSNNVLHQPVDDSSKKAYALKTDTKQQKGPDRLPPQLDDTKQWSAVASEPGYQKGDQGGYKGSPDETKLEQINDKDLKSQPGERSQK